MDLLTRKRLKGFWKSTIVVSGAEYTLIAIVKTKLWTQTNGPKWYQRVRTITLKKTLEAKIARTPKKRARYSGTTKRTL